MTFLGLSHSLRPSHQTAAMKRLRSSKYTENKTCKPIEQKNALGNVKNNAAESVQIIRISRNYGNFQKLVRYQPCTSERVTLQNLYSNKTY